MISADRFHHLKCLPEGEYPLNSSTRRPAGAEAGGFGELTWLVVFAWLRGVSDERIGRLFN